MVYSVVAIGGDIKMIKTKFNVTGMTCAACSAHVEKSVRKLEGVAEVLSLIHI